MHVKSAREVPEYEIHPNHPRELDFTNSIEITKTSIQSTYIIASWGGTQVAVNIFLEGTAEEHKAGTFSLHEYLKRKCALKPAKLKQSSINTVMIRQAGDLKFDRLIPTVLTLLELGARWLRLSIRGENLLWFLAYG
ncbi:hypothetical protein CASFOL_035478 [Castilleja foliolosa]|uniref:Uncharacterized protein n=1 Tax=Castilleja foliolosa TaxID=1961234 RepID=A0ABD3BTZ4_9LAMI